MSVQGKVILLGLKEVDDNIYYEYFGDSVLRGCDASKWKYYKYYGKHDEQIFFYSEKYISENTVEELVQMDQRNKKMFEPTLLTRTRRKLDGIGMRLYLLKRKWAR